MATTRTGEAFISFRIGVPLWRPEARFEEVLSLLDEHPGLADEIALFTSETHPPLPLREVAQRAEILERRMAAARKRGYAAGVNVLSTLGHHEEDLAHSLGEDYPRMTDIEGRVCRGTLCPEHERVHEYVRELYRTVALAGPDFVWVDDDVRCLGHWPICGGCFCDTCLARFAQECGREYTRETLRAAFDTGSPADRLAARRAWLAHNRGLIGRLLALIEETVHEIRPGLPLGFMTGDRFGEGYDFDAWAAVLAGPGNAEVRWRPGGGFYSDEHLDGLVAKSHTIGRQVSLLPPAVRNVQSEIENFPYQRLRKAARTTALEAASHIAAGCTGAALNVLSMYDEPLGEYRALVAELHASRGFYDLLVRTFGRQASCGVWGAWGKDSFAAHNLAAGAWMGNGDAPLWVPPGEEMLELGVPAAYAPDAGCVVAMAGDAPMSFPEAELRRMLSGGVYLDARALCRLHERGLGGLAGFRVAGTHDADCIEVFTDHPINGPFAGRRRDGRQSFWKSRASALVPSGGASALACLQDYAGSEICACCLGVFENELGGRVCVAGYYPWAQLSSLAKASQIKRILRWLSRDALPLYVESFHRAAVWVRRNGAGGLAFALINTSLDEARELAVMVRTDASCLRVFDWRCQETAVPACGTDGPYRRFTLPRLGPWAMILGIA